MSGASDDGAAGDDGSPDAPRDAPREEWKGDRPSTTARALLARPDLWWTGMTVLRRLAPPRWWRGRPHLPVPHRVWWRFRMVTAYGRPDARPRSGDVIAYLEWCRSTGSRDQHRRRRRGDPAAERLEARRSG